MHETVSPPRTLRLGTRGSALAMTQSRLVAAALRSRGVPVQLVAIRTTGDSRPPNTVWGEGAFVTELEAALLDHRVDLAVHSAKDVPTREDARLVVAAYPAREDPRDALVCRIPGATLATLPAGSRIGSDSPRRRAFLLARRPDLVVAPLHGNVDTRLRRLADGEADALVLAVAGLRRLGLDGRIDEPLDPSVVPPAPGQGALAIQARFDDALVRELLAPLDDAATRAAVEAERAFLEASGGGCRAPLGALGTVRDGRLRLIAAAADEACRTVWDERTGAPADGRALASALAAALQAALAAAAKADAAPALPAASSLPIRTLEEARA